MSTEFNFRVMDANQPIETQQSIVRDIVSATINLPSYQKPNVQTS
jgi:hypothetical protein